MIKFGISKSFIMGLLLVLGFFSSCSNQSVSSIPYYCRLRFHEPCICIDSSDVAYIYNRNSPNRYVLYCTDEYLQELIETTSDTVINDELQFRVKKKYANTKYVVSIVGRYLAVRNNSFDAFQTEYNVTLCPPDMIKLYHWGKYYKTKLKIIFSRCYMNEIPKTIIRKNVSQKSPYYVVQASSGKVLSIPFCYWRDFDMVESYPIIINNVIPERKKIGIQLGKYQVYEDSSLIDDSYILTLKRSFSNASIYYGELTAHQP